MYTEADLEGLTADECRVVADKIGTLKPAHIHLVVQYYNPVHSSAIAKDIGLPERQIQKAKAKRNQFIAIAAYFTHEDRKQQELGKARYYDNEIYSSQNFDFRKEVDSYFSGRKIYTSANMPKYKVHDIIEQVAKGKISLQGLKSEYGYAFFVEHEQKFLKAYREYIKTVHEMQPRINIYIEGKPGKGKSTLAVELAKALYPNLDENEAYFVAGKQGVRFDDYSYQPVIIWDDVRIDEMMPEFGREGMLNLLEIHPKKVNYNIKYGGVILVNQVNIINGIDSHEKFLNGIVDKYNDKSGKEHKGELEEIEQAYRRMAIVLRVYGRYFDVMLNQGLYNAVGSYMTFERAMRVMLDIRSMNLHYTGDARREMLSDALKPITKKFEEYMRTNHEEVLIGEEYAAQHIEIITQEKLNAREEREYLIYTKECEKKEMAPISIEVWREAGCPLSPDGESTDTYREDAIRMKKEIEENDKLMRWLDNANGFGQKYSEIDWSTLPDDEYIRLEKYYRVIEDLNRMYEELEELSKGIVERRKEAGSDGGFPEETNWPELEDIDIVDEYDASEDDEDEDEEDGYYMSGDEIDDSLETSDNTEDYEEVREKVKHLVNECADYLLDKYYFYKEEPIVKNIANLVARIGLIDTENDFESYIYDKNR